VSGPVNGKDLQAPALEPGGPFRSANSLQNQTFNKDGLMKCPNDDEEREVGDCGDGNKWNKCATEFITLGEKESQRDVAIIEESETLKTVTKLAQRSDRLIYRLKYKLSQFNQSRPSSLLLII